MTGVVFVVAAPFSERVASYKHPNFVLTYTFGNWVGKTSFLGGWGRAHWQRFANCQSIIFLLNFIGPIAVSSVCGLHFVHCRHGGALGKTPSTLLVDACGAAT